MHKIKLWHYVPSFIITLFLTLFILSFEAIMFLTQTVLKTKTYTDILTQNSVIDMVYNDIEEYFKKLEASTGVPAKVYMQGVDRVLISESAFSYFDQNVNYLSGKSEAIPKTAYNFTKLDESVYDYFDNYAGENNIDPKDSKYLQLRDKALEKAHSYIESNMDFLFFRYLNRGNALTKIHNNIKYIYIAKNALIFLIIALVLLLIRINRHHLHSVLYWISTSVFVAGLIGIIPAAILKFTNYFENIIIKTQYLRVALTSLLNTILEKYLILMEMTLFAGFVMAVVYYSILLSGRIKFKKNK